MEGQGVIVGSWITRISQIIILVIPIVNLLCPPDPRSSLYGAVPKVGVPLQRLSVGVIPGREREREIGVYTVAILAQVSDPALSFGEGCQAPAPFLPGGLPWEGGGWTCVLRGEA